MAAGDTDRSETGEIGAAASGEGVTGKLGDPPRRQLAGAAQKRSEEKAGERPSPGAAGSVPLRKSVLA